MVCSYFIIEQELLQCYIYRAKRRKCTMKKFLTAAICSILTVSLCACSGVNLPGAPSPAATPAAAAVPDVEKQLALLERSSSLWKMKTDATSAAPYYAVTDLDKNGRLELFSAITQGTGSFTSGHLFEVDPTGTTLYEYPLVSGDGDFIPEVIVNQANCYEDASTGTFFYVFLDSTRSGSSESYTGKVSFSLKDGSVSRKDIASEYLFVENGNTYTVYRDGDGNTITGDKYNNSEADYFSGMTLSRQPFGWFTFDGETLPELLASSRKVFSGELPSMPPSASAVQAEAAPQFAQDTVPAIPVQTQAPQSTLPVITPKPKSSESAQPAALPSDIISLPGQFLDIPVGSSGNIKITKNPTSESLAVGGKTWFIAHASNATSLTWQFIDGYNSRHSVDETMALNPGLSLQVLEGDTIAVSNVPISLNGWSVQAVFSNGTYSAATTPAMIYIGDFVSSYQSVLAKYRNAYASGAELNYGTTSAFGISEMAGYSRKAGYAMKDLDKDGVPELIISGTGSENHADNIVYEIYTLINGFPSQLCVSYARDRYYIRTDNSVYNSGSGGAACTISRVLKLTNGQLVETENLNSDLDQNGGVAWFYSQPNIYPAQMQVSETEALSMINSYEQSIYMPQLTVIQ